MVAHMPGFSRLMLFRAGRAVELRPQVIPRGTQPSLRDVRRENLDYPNALVRKDPPLEALTTPLERLAWTH